MPDRELLVAIRREIAASRDYNQHWLLERHGYRTSHQARDAHRQDAIT